MVVRHPRNKVWKVSCLWWRHSLLPNSNLNAGYPSLEEHCAIQWQKVDGPKGQALPSGPFVCVCDPVPMYMCRSQQSPTGVIPQKLSHLAFALLIFILFLRQGVSLGTRDSHVRPDLRASKTQEPNPICFSLCVTGFTGIDYFTWYFRFGAGNQVQFSCFHGEPSTY